MQRMQFVGGPFRPAFEGDAVQLIHQVVGGEEGSLVRLEHSPPDQPFDVLVVGGRPRVGVELPGPDPGPDGRDDVPARVPPRERVVG